jgi:hypothetical protein
MDKQPSLKKITCYMNNAPQFHLTITGHYLALQAMYTGQNPLALFFPHEVWQKNICTPFGYIWVARWLSRLRHYVTNQQIAGLIPNGFIGIFQ